MFDDSKVTVFVENRRLRKDIRSKPLAAQLRQKQERPYGIVQQSQQRACLKTQPKDHNSAHGVFVSPNLYLLFKAVEPRKANPERR